MKKYILKSVFATALLASTISCTRSDNPYESKAKEITTTELATTKTVASIINPTLPATVPTTPTLYTGDDVIEAYVTSSDAGGTFYKSLSFQDVQTSAGTPLGFSVSVDQSMLFQRGFFPGRKVYIKLKGLYYARVFGTVQFGGGVDPSTGFIIGIGGLDLNKYLFPSATIVDENTLVRHMSLTAAANDAVQNTLVEIDNVQFADNSLARTYFDIDSGGFATNHDIVDATLGGTTRYCRISQFAPFSSNKVPSGRGSIRGVMTKYNTDYQFIVRSEPDFKLTNPRTYTFNGTLTENFSSFATNQLAFPNYVNFATVGTKKWLIKSGAIEMSAFGGNVENSKAYFLIPVNMTAANSIKFDIKAGFYTNGLGLKVYRTTDYVPGMKISDATLADITSSFTLPTGSTTVFSSSGVYTIPSNVTGNGYFVFEYTGTNITTGPPVTTTVDIDNIVVN